MWQDAEPSLQKEPWASWGATDPGCSGSWWCLHRQEDAGARILTQDPRCQRLDIASLFCCQRKREMCSSFSGAWRSETCFLSSPWVVGGGGTRGRKWGEREGNYMQQKLPGELKQGINFSDLSLFHDLKTCDFHKATIFSCKSLVLLYQVSCNFLS